MCNYDRIVTIRFGFVEKANLCIVIQLITQS